MGTRVNYSGLVVAGTGFALTRFTVVLAVNEAPVRFYLSGVVPLVLGLGLSAFGVALTVADVEPGVARTTAVWCVLGTMSMFVLVVLTLLGSEPETFTSVATLRSRTYLSNFLIGGSVGGTLTGLYAARNRQQRARLGRQTTRLTVLNQLLRHEVLNGLTAIRGYASVRETGDSRARQVITDRSDDIEETIDEVGYLTESAGPEDTPVAPVSVRKHVERSVESVREEYPEAEVTVDHADGDVDVLANDRLGYVFGHLVENAVAHNPRGTTVTVSTSVKADTVRVAVRDSGEGLPEREQRLLETGTVETGSGPRSGFGLYFVRFLVTNLDGFIETDVGPDGTTVTVVLPRADTPGVSLAREESRTNAVRPGTPQLVLIVVSALIAGVFYGVAAELAGGSVGIIGVFYGVEHTVVGWITHQFHSVVFGFVFAGLVTLGPPRYRDSVPAYVLVGTAWALVLWFVAAGFVSAAWLRLLGIPASVPNLSVVTLVAHLAWGPVLGALTALGYRHLAEPLARAGDRLLGG
ncbi:MAG: HAMP domain-containing sensor histidine kinase [Haloarculaceae archaeon]